MFKKSIIYRYLVDALLKYSNNNYIDLKKAKWVLNRHSIPKYIAFKVLKEMEEANLIKQINQRKFKIKKLDDKI